MIKIHGFEQYGREAIEFIWENREYIGTGTLILGVIGLTARIRTIYEARDDSNPRNNRVYND